MYKWYANVLCLLGRKQGLANHSSPRENSIVLCTHFAQHNMSIHGYKNIILFKIKFQNDIWFWIYFLLIIISTD